MIDIITATYALFVVWLLGFLFLRIMNLRSTDATILTSVPVDFGVGSGLLYLILFLTSITIGQLRPFVAYLVLTTLAALNYVKCRQRPRLRLPTREEATRVAFVITISLLILMPTVEKGLDGDGWAIWAFKAKVFFEDGKVSGSFLSDMERYAYAHLDYPLLVPLLEYWVYAHLGHVNDHVVRLVPISFWILMLIFFYSTILERMKNLYAVLSTFSLALVWPIAENAVLGLVDGVQSFYNLIGMVYLFKWLEKGDSKALWIIALILGFGANVKNEGLSFWMATIFVLTLSYIRNIFAKKSYSSLLDLIKFSLVGMIVCAPWIIEKRVLGIKSELFLKAVPDFGILLDRFWRLLTYYINEVISVGYSGWGLLWIFTSFAIMMMAYYSNLKEERYQVCLVICLLQLLIFAGIYIVTPYELDYHLQTSGGRTLLQIVPAIFWIGMMAAFSGKVQAPRL